MVEITDRQQSLLMFGAFLIPAVVLWVTSPDPLTAESSLRTLLAGLLGGILAGIKELAGYKPKVTTA